MMAPNEYVGVLVGKEATNGEYVISDGVMTPGGTVPDRCHKLEDQTFHILEPKFSSWGKTELWQVVDVEPIVVFGKFNNG